MRLHAYRPGARFAALAAIIVPTAALVLAVGCQTKTVPVQPQQSAEAALPGYVGNSACAECHKNECEHQRETSHARSLRHADRRSLGSLAPPTGPIPDSDYTIHAQGNELKMARNDQPEVSATLQYAFGSGKSVVTYVGEIGVDRLTELRMSFVPNETNKGKRWITTPSQASTADLNIGHVYELGMAKKCVLCHADRLTANSVAPAEDSLGIGCESCHGPGAAHIAAARVPHAPDLKIEKIGNWGAARINTLCGRCHRSQDDVELVGHDATNTTRFQAYGLALSPCFKMSGDRLSCITCHDSHTDVYADKRHYEKVCLSCHSPALGRTETAGSRTAAPRFVVSATPCPVNAHDGCVGCHMPKRPIMPGTNLPISISDHLIWAYRPKR